MDEANKIQILLSVLNKIPLFSTLNEQLHREIIDHVTLMYYPADYIIFKQEDAGDAMYIIKNGSVEITHEPLEEGDLPKHVAEINSNGFFGEMALISDVPRNATATTATECEIFILKKEDFKKLLETNVKMAEQISTTVISRIKENNK